MIEKFCLLTYKGSLIKANITPNTEDSLFESASEEVYKEYSNGSSQGIRWEYMNNEVKLLENGQKIFGLPTSDMKRVVIVYPYDHPVYSSPKNAVIYNGDGSIYMQLTAPKPISDLAMKQRRAIFSSDNPLSLYFDNVRWAKNSKGGIVTAVQIGFDRDWLETRELNTETGEFGECLSSGRR